MTQTPIKLSFQEYLNYDDGTDNRYELVDGELVMVPLPSADHVDVIDLLSKAFEAQISQQKSPWLVKREVGVYIGTNPATGRELSRNPDLIVATAAQWIALKALKKPSAVLQTPPLLVVEVVSPGSKKTDYESKESEYSNVGIPEYWIIDLKRARVSVRRRADSGCYEPQEFTGRQRIISPTFPELTLTVEQILAA